jgi:hypothetical protein
MIFSEKMKRRVREDIRENEEKAVKGYINKFLRFMKSLKANTKNDPKVYDFICKIDERCANILLDDTYPLCKRAKQLHGKLSNSVANKRKSLKDCKSEEWKVYHLKTLKHLKTIMNRLEELEFASNEAVTIIRYKDIKKDTVFTVDKSKEENIECKFYPEGDHDRCLCGMDMVYCSKNCAYATTLPDKLRSTYNENGYMYVGGGESGAILWGKGRKKSPLPHSPTVQKKQKELYWKHYLRDEHYNEIEGRKGSV